MLFTSHYVTINSYTSLANFYKELLFTSHYVTINSCSAPYCCIIDTHLHPTM